MDSVANVERHGRANGCSYIMSDVGSGEETMQVCSISMNVTVQCRVRGNIAK